jgi:hypothetical protein
MLGGAAGETAAREVAGTVSVCTHAWYRDGEGSPRSESGSQGMGLLAAAEPAGKVGRSWRFNLLSGIVVHDDTSHHEQSGPGGLSDHDAGTAGPATVTRVGLPITEVARKAGGSGRAAGLGFRVGSLN